MKIKDMFNNLKQKTKINVVKGLAALVFAASGLTGCGDILDPLGTKINGVTTAPSSYVFSGQNAEVKFKPTGKPYQKVEGTYHNPGEDYCCWQELTDDDGDGEYNLNISSTPSPGDYKAKFKTTCGLTSKESDEETIPVYMNESQSDSALEEAVQEMGIANMAHDQYYFQSGGDPTTISENEIMSEWGPNFVDIGEEFDIMLGMKCDRARGPPTYEGLYYIDIKGSNNETFNQAKKDKVNGNYNGYLFLDPVKSVDDIKTRLQEEKDDSWPQVN
jgi:hypothetical protein